MGVRETVELVSGTSPSELEAKRQRLAKLRAEVDSGECFASRFEQIERLIADTKGRARPQDYGLQSVPNPSPFLFVACLPKSGSTFLTNALAMCLGFTHRHWFYEAHQNEQDICLEKALGEGFSGQVIQQHMRASERNLQVLQALQVRPVVLVRNIFNALASMRDMLRVSLESVFFSDMFNLFDENLRTRAVAAKYGFWYIEFYASWVRAIRDNRINAYLVSYEELILDKTETMRKVLAHAGYTVPEADLKQAIATLNANSTRSRRTAERSNRLASFDADLREYIQGHTTLFPDIDFTPLGLNA